MSQQMPHWSWSAAKLLTASPSDYAAHSERRLSLGLRANRREPDEPDRLDERLELGAASYNLSYGYESNCQMLWIWQ
jgi:hypothetical protein